MLPSLASHVVDLGSSTASQQFHPPSLCVGPSHRNSVASGYMHHASAKAGTTHRSRGSGMFHVLGPNSLPLKMLPYSQLVILAPSYFANMSWAWEVRSK